MFIFDRSKLVPGDVLMTTQDAFKSKVIRKATDSAFSHAILYVGASSYIHSDGDGVHSGNLQRLLLSSPGYGMALRIKDSSHEMLGPICDFARKEIGKSYSVSGAVKAKLKGVPISKSQKNKQFCSRLVCQAFENAKVALAKDCLFCTPAEIVQSDLLIEVPGCIRPATPEEITFAKSESMLDVQVRATNAILEKAREVSGQDIQTFEQVANLLLKYPEYDAAISAVVVSSGYCDMWKIDVENNPWRYDGARFCALGVGKSQLAEMAELEMNNASEMLARFRKLREQYSTAYAYTGLKYFEVQTALYAALVDAHASRKEASMLVLKALKSSGWC